MRWPSSSRNGGAGNWRARLPIMHVGRWQRKPPGPPASAAARPAASTPGPPRPADEQLAHLVARHEVAALVGHREALRPGVDGLLRWPGGEVALAQQLIDLGELRAQLQGAAERLDRLGELAGLHAAARRAGSGPARWSGRPSPSCGNGRSFPGSHSSQLLLFPVRLPEAWHEGVELDAGRTTGVHALPGLTAFVTVILRDCYLVSSTVRSSSSLVVSCR